MFLITSCEKHIFLSLVKKIFGIASVLFKLESFWGGLYEKGGRREGEGGFQEKFVVF